MMLRSDEKGLDLMIDVVCASKEDGRNYVVARTLVLNSRTRLF